MKRKLLTLTVLLTGLFLYNSCTSDNYLTEYEVRNLIEQIIKENNKENLSETEIKQIIESALREYDKNPFTEEEIQSIIEQIIRENNLNTLTEAQIKQLIEQAIKDNNQQLEFTQWEIIQVPVKASDWEWVYIKGHPDKGHWEAVAELPELTEFIYENGAALGYVFLGEPGVDEVQKSLPYVQSHYDGDDEFGNPVFFTETISCDFQYGNPSTVAFYIEANDLFEDSAAPNNYYFRVVLIW